MARQLNDVLDLEREIDGYRDALQLVKTELHRIRKEYMEGATGLTAGAIEEIDSELETLTLTVESALF